MSMDFGVLTNIISSLGWTDREKKSNSVFLYENHFSNDRFTLKGCVIYPYFHTEADNLNFIQSHFSLIVVPSRGPTQLCKTMDVS